MSHLSLLDQAREAPVEHPPSGTNIHPGKVVLPVEARDALVELVDACSNYFMRAYTQEKEQRMVEALERLGR